jgi:hypothetical protein
MQMTNLTCPTNREVLQLTAIVAPLFDQPSRYRYTYRLTNPAGNTVRVAGFSIATSGNLGGIFFNTTPFGWLASLTGTPGQQQITWSWIPDNPTNPTNTAARLDPGETFDFAFTLGRNASPTGGSVTAENCWVGTTLGPGIDEPPGGVIPEPSTVALLGIGLLPLAVLLRRR